MAESIFQLTLCLLLFCVFSIKQTAAEGYEYKELTLTTPYLSPLGLGLNRHGYHQRDNLWQLYTNCTPLLKVYGQVASNYATCVVQSSIPPLICTNCFHEYTNLTTAKQNLTKATAVEVFDGSTCADVMFRKYLVSFVDQIYWGLIDGTWNKAKCDSCFITNSVGSTTVRSHTKHYEKYMNLLNSWRKCVTNYTFESDYQFRGMSENASRRICSHCWKDYEQLYSFYWSIFVAPHVDFCLDVDATMNDTTMLWRSVLGCKKPQLPARGEETFMVIAICSFVFVFTIIFYLGSYLQGERQKRNLIKYSNLDATDFQPDDDPRMRRPSTVLLSSPTTETPGDTPVLTENAPLHNAIGRTNPNYRSFDATDASGVQ